MMFGRYKKLTSRLEEIREWFRDELSKLERMMNKEFREEGAKIDRLGKRVERLEDRDILLKHAGIIGELERDVKRLTGEVELLVYRLDYPEQYKKLLSAQGSLDRLHQHKTPRIIESSFDFKGAPTVEPERVMMELKSERFRIEGID